MVQEVAILFENYLWRGNRSTKMSADNFNAFKSNNYPPLAALGLAIQYNHDALWRMRERHPLKVHSGMCSDIIVVYVYPACRKPTCSSSSKPRRERNRAQNLWCRQRPHCQMVQRGYKKSCRPGLVILNVTQCVNGGVRQKRYYTGNLLDRAGVISGHDITTEAALTKMMFLFGTGLNARQVARCLHHPLCGEMTV